MSRALTGSEAPPAFRTLEGPPPHACQREKQLASIRRSIIAFQSELGDAIIEFDNAQLLSAGEVCMSWLKDASKCVDESRAYKEWP